MLNGENRKCRAKAKAKTLLLCIRRYELQEVLGFEYFELLRMHIFDHEDLKTRMTELSTKIAEEKGQLIKFK